MLCLSATCWDEPAQRRLRGTGPSGITATLDGMSKTVADAAFRLVDALEPVSDALPDR